MNKFLEYREKYPNFIYESYKIEKLGSEIKITFNFEIEGLTKFNPTLTINNKDIKNKNINESYLNYLTFHIGLIEIISYIKATCSKNIIIKCGYLNLDQINFFKKLYYYGLGEFLYTNNIKITEEELFEFKIECEKQPLDEIEYKSSGNLIPIGGGKDSCVTLELLKDEYDDNQTFTLNPKEAHLKTIEIAKYQDKNITVKRTIDKNLIELNNKGFLNGHTPFSSLIAFITYLTAYLTEKKYIILSNEGSANEATVIGTKINHQYSKTYEFESDFNNYTKKYFKLDIKYFSLLRPLKEYQIGLLFSNYEKYHKVFKSCNVGSKSIPWNWCCKCSKCLFVYTILSPFLYKEKLIKIFGKDLFKDESLKETYKELLGYSKTKPFECVGEINEVRYASSILINKLGDDLPYLLRYYKENYPLELNHDLEHYFNPKHNLDEHFLNILKKELMKYVK